MSLTLNTRPARQRRAKLRTQGSNPFLRILCLAGLACFFCLVRLSFWLIDNQVSQQETTQVTEQASLQTTPSFTNNPNQAQTASVHSDQTFDPYWDFQTTNYLSADFTQLQTTNPSTVAWLHINGTNVNYPVVQHSDNNYYLNHTFSGSRNSAGWVFMDYRNLSFQSRETPYDPHTIIYAHARQDDSMFGSLRWIFSPNWFSNPDNSIIQISSPHTNSLWQIFSIYQTSNTNDYLQTNFPETRMFTDFVHLLQSRSLFNFGTTVSFSDHILTLSTCANTNDRLVVHAKLVKSQTR